VIRDLGKQVSRVKIIVAEHRVRALVQHRPTRRKICGDPPRKIGGAASVREFPELPVALM
jgi:hypothetical protein